MKLFAELEVLDAIAIDGVVGHTAVLLVVIRILLSLQDFSLDFGNDFLFSFVQALLLLVCTLHLRMKKALFWLLKE